MTRRIARSSRAQAILAEAGIPASALELVMHGATLATNAPIERKGARIALVATEGFRDSLEIAYEHRFEQYDLYMERPAPLVETLRAQRIQAVAVSFLHAYVNPMHEQRARDLLTRAMPELAITLS